LLESALILLGLALLAAGGELLVRSAVGLARRFGVSPLLIGSTLIAFGTSLPEMVVSIEAVLHDRPGIAIGNVVGSNISNILLILGITAAIRPVFCARRALFRDASFATVATILFLAVALLEGVIRPWHGGTMLAMLLAYQFMTYRHERAVADASAVLHRREASEIDPPTRRLYLNVILLMFGLALLPIGAKLLVENASILALQLGVSDAVIGLTVIAVGTSLPELATSLVAALRRHGDVAFGNIIGSNIFNLLAILGVTAFFGDIPVPLEIIRFDMWIMFASMLLLLPVIVTGYRIGRLHGIALCGVYGGYIVLLYMRNGA
jgi:cation:H+ antiporter